MSNETRDPREAVLADWEEAVENQWEGSEPVASTADVLARLDAADPRLAMWGEVVEALEAVDAPEEHAAQCEDCEEAREEADTNDTGCREWVELLGRSIVLRQKTRARAIDATNQGGDA